MNTVVLYADQAAAVGTLTELLTPFGMTCLAIREHQGEPGLDDAQLIVTVAGPAGAGDLVDVTLTPRGQVRTIAPLHSPWRRQIEHALGVAA